MKIEIKEIKIDDVNDELFNVFKEGYEFHRKGRPDIFVSLSDEELLKNFLDLFDKYTTIIVLADNKIVGYLSYLIKKSYKSKLYIEQLIIKEEFRGIGLGSKLIEKVKQIAIINQCDRIELDCWMFNENALNMYEHIGFQKQRIIYEKKIN